MIMSYLVNVLNPFKTQAELDRVVGPNRHPCIEDQPYLPYSQVNKNKKQKQDLKMFFVF